MHGPLPAGATGPDVVDSLPVAEGALAVRLITMAAGAGPGGLLFVARSADRAARLADLAMALAPDLPVLHLPPWDCLPYDRAPPSPEVMGRRVGVLARLAAGIDRPHLVLSAASALMQRVPPPTVWAGATLRLRPGGAVELARLEAFLRRTGYRLDDRVDEPGEAALRGGVVDIFPGAATRPVRIDHADGRITGLRAYDPATQRGVEELAELELLPISEAVTAEGEERPPGLEHRLPALYGPLPSPLDLLADAALLLEPEVEDRAQAFLELVADAHATRTRLAAARRAEETPRPAPAELYLTAEAWQAALARHRVRIAATRDLPAAEGDGKGEARPPRFAAQPDAGRRFASFVTERRKAGQRVVLAAPAGAVARRLARFAQRHLGQAPDTVAGWAGVVAAPAGSLLLLHADLAEGVETGPAVILPADAVLGSRAGRADGEREGSPFARAAAAPAPGEAVIHDAHGLARLDGLVPLDGPDGAGEAVRLLFRDGDVLMLPVAELSRLWRYGAEGDGVTLDRMDGTSWARRRDKVAEELRHAAVELVARARTRLDRPAPVLRPPRAAYERFAGGFPFTETPDQAAAIAAVLDDLAAGRPMDRLVCGDVGYGKTEVALRAAAAAALAGRQVLLVAPTTVLARQHAEIFRARFRGTGLTIAHLSRLTPAGEARKIKAGLKDGSIRVVVGTHALAGKGVAFHDPGLLILDEEQRFGAKEKAGLRALGEGLHVLTLTATPIPQTLQSALVGLRDLSLITTPPARRQPIATFTLPWDPASVREALLREAGRDGQSFVVCPRVADMDWLRQQLAELVPELEVLTAHGQMKADQVDEVMVRFAGGDGDVLLATNIIESGLDVPCANTMLVWRADRFGLSQLHQLRGRVGRGRVRGVCYLMTAPGAELGEAAADRLRTLEAFDRLGAGFAISARDMDLRGAGDLLGEAQAGHARLVGIGLYQDMVARAMAVARGEVPPPDWTPDIRIGGLPAAIPAELVPEPEVRLRLYARAARLDGDDAVADFADELEDRFGPPPVEMRGWLALVALRPGCHRAGITRLEAGPKGAVAEFRDAAARRRAASVATGDGLDWSGERLLLRRAAESAEARLAAARDLLEALLPRG